MNVVLQFIGFCVALYWFVGLLMLAFYAKVYVYPGAPLHAKLGTVLAAPWFLPMIWWRTGRAPIAVIAPADDPEAEAKVKEWMKSHCPCPACKARRGE